jgi:hypothetical protein
MFDSIHIDCVWGLNETKDGYIGFLLIVCKASKWKEVYPLKTKTAEEIEKNLIKWFTTYGPSKEIISDQGPEFMNKIIEQLCKNNNITKKFTSSYNPRTNGQAERSNQTFTRIIQKLSIDNPSNWTDYIPFALLAYRTKVHKSTKFSPYELVFGRKMNEFKNWTTENDEDEEASLLKRTIEIKILEEQTQPKALENIKKARDNRRIPKTNKKMARKRTKLKKDQ